MQDAQGNFYNDHLQELRVLSSEENKIKTQVLDDLQKHFQRCHKKARNHFSFLLLCVKAHNTDL